VNKRIHPRRYPNAIYFVNVTKMPDDNGAYVVIPLQKYGRFILQIDDVRIGVFIVFRQIE
jgi:hypothetical protein